MKAVPSYTKILTLGSSGTENALSGPIVVQEKVDGSLFAFGMNEDGELVMRSKGLALTEDAHAMMFDTAVKYVLSLKEQIKTLRDVYFYCEYLEKPKHNTLKYERTPKNNLVMFDALDNGRWLGRGELIPYSSHFEIDLIPEFIVGEFKKEQIPEFLQRESYLGGQKVEGLVMKNYAQTIMLGGHVFPLFTKYVSEAFKEKHTVDWKIRQPKTTLEDYVKGFKSEARWQKAIIHAREQGKLTNSPKDIGFLLKFIQQDIIEEEEENIKKYLFKCFKDDVMRHSIHGFPEWYKQKLLENVK